MFVKLLEKKWFTLTELVISVAIGAILLVFIFQFVINTIEVLSETTRKARILTQFYGFIVKVDNYKNVFWSGNIVRDYLPGWWFDVVVLKNYNSTRGVLFWIIDKDTLKLDPLSNYNTFWKKYIWYRDLITSDLTAIQADPNIVYDYNFFEDKIYEEVTIKDFQFDFYNTGTILDVDVSIFLWIGDEYNWVNWNSIPKDDIYKVNLNF